MGLLSAHFSLPLVNRGLLKDSFMRGEEQDSTSGFLSV